MKNLTNQRTTITYALLFLVVGILLFSQYRGSFSAEERFLFLTLMLVYWWIVFLLLTAIVWFHIQLFEPITIVSVLYIAIFILKPVVDLHTNELIEHNVDVLPGGARATLLFALGYTSLFFAYFSRHKKIRFRRGQSDHPEETATPLLQDGIWLPALYISWVAVYVLCLLGMMTQGLIMRYIFSFGTDGYRNVDNMDSSLLFLSNFGVTLVSLWSIILDRSDNVAWKAITTVLCVVYIIMRNARWLALVFLSAPIILYCTKRNCQPRMLWVVVAGVLGLAVFAWMQANRYRLARGDAMVFWGLQDLTLNNLLAPLETDLSTYRAFYSMTVRYPDTYPYMIGKTFFYTLVLFVPRALWAGKPDNPVREMIEHSLNMRARLSGTAVANIGEFYANFGVLGVLAGLYLFGMVLAMLKKRFLEATERKDTDFLCLYAVLFPLLYQWVARGNFCGNFYLTLFAILPYWARLLFRRRKKV